MWPSQFDTSLLVYRYHQTEVSSLTSFPMKQNSPRQAESHSVSLPTHHPPPPSPQVPLQTETTAVWCDGAVCLWLLLEDICVMDLSRDLRSGVVETSPNWPWSSQRTWLIADQLAADTCADRPAESWKCRATRAERLWLATSSKTVLMTSPLHVLFLCPRCSAYTAEDSPRAKTINYACY